MLKYLLLLTLCSNIDAMRRITQMRHISSGARTLATATREELIRSNTFALWNKFGSIASIKDHTPNIPEIFAHYQPSLWTNNRGMMHKKVDWPTIGRAITKRKLIPGFEELKDSCTVVSFNHETNTLYFDVTENQITHTVISYNLNDHIVSYIIVPSGHNLLALDGYNNYALLVKQETGRLCYWALDQSDYFESTMSHLPGAVISLTPQPRVLVYHLAPYTPLLLSIDREDSQIAAYTDQKDIPCIQHLVAYDSIMGLSKSGSICITSLSSGQMCEINTRTRKHENFRLSQDGLSFLLRRKCLGQKPYRVVTIRPYVEKLSDDDLRELLLLPE